MIKVAFYDTKPYDHEAALAAEGAAALQWTFHDFRLTAETASTAAGADAVCVFVNDKLDRACLEKLAALGVKLVALRCAGFNQVDLPAARELGIAVTRVPAYSPHAVAEHAVALLMTLNRKIHRAYNRVREHNFALAGLVGFDLYGKTAGIVGTGKIGRCTAEIFRGFGMQVVAHDPFPQEAWAIEHKIRYAPLEEVLRVSDVLSLHLPLAAGTHHLLNRETLAQMKPGACLINTSRGKLVDSAALIEALKSGHLGGVALDVYEEEEGIFFEDHSGAVLQDDTLALLLSLPNVLVTSHQAFLTREALSEIARVTVTNLGMVNQGVFLPETLLT
jgi:D-lactate dehydrogenase